MFEINRKMAFYPQGPDPYIPKILEDIQKIKVEQEETKGTKETMQELISAHNALHTDYKELKDYTYKTAQTLINNVNYLDERITKLIESIPAPKKDSNGSTPTMGGRPTRRRRRKQ